MQAHLDVGLDGLIVDMPYLYDLEEVDRAGRTPSSVIAG